MFEENYLILIVNIIVHRKAPLNELLKDFNEVIEWDIKEQAVYKY